MLEYDMAINIENVLGKIKPKREVPSALPVNTDRVIALDEATRGEGGSVGELTQAEQVNELILRLGDSSSWKRSAS